MKGTNESQSFVLILEREVPFQIMFHERQKIVQPDIFGKNSENPTFTLISIGFHRFSWVCERYNPDIFSAWTAFVPRPVIN
jgi:hypothetical protein